MQTQNMNSLDRWISVLGGGMLTVSAMRKRSALRSLKLLLGAELVRRGIMGRSYAYQAFGIRTLPSDSPGPIPSELGVRVKSAVTIAKPREVVYQFWRDLEHLPLFMKHVTSVEVRDGRFSRWTAQGPVGQRLEWDAEIISEAENERIGWRSLPGSDVDSAGSVHFKDAPGGRGTEVLVKLQYNPQGGYVGALLAKLFGQAPEQEIEADLFRLKQYLECGEIATTAGQPHGHPKSRPSRPLLAERKPPLSQVERKTPLGVVV